MQRTHPTQNTARMLLPQVEQGYEPFGDERLEGTATFSDRGVGVSLDGEDELLCRFEPGADKFQPYITAASVLKARAAVARGFVR
jgi:hypothetical protein